MITITVTESVRALLEHALGRFIGGARPPEAVLLTVAGQTYDASTLIDAYDAVADAPRNGVRGFLDLSTSHLQASTREMWTESFDAEHFPTPAWCGETGWLLFVPASNDAWDHVCGPELPEIFDRARALGVEYVRFDEGAPVIEALPTFDEEEGCPVEDPGCDNGAGSCHDACERPAEAATPFVFTAEDDAFIQALKVQNFDASQIAPLLARRTGVPCSRTDVAVRLADLATVEAVDG